MTVKKQKTSVATMPQMATGGKDFLTAKEAAGYIGASLNYFYKLTSSHRLPMYNPTGRKLLFKRCELQAWIEQSRVSTDDELSEQAELELMKKGGRK
jgi:excisionase family DNA binding protein